MQPPGPVGTSFSLSLKQPAPVERLCERRLAEGSQVDKCEGRDTRSQVDGSIPVISFAESSSLAHETMSIPGFLGPFPKLLPSSDKVESI